MTFLRLVALLMVAACTQATDAAGRGLARGIQEEAASLPADQPGPGFERAGRGITKGAVEQLAEPAQTAQLEHLVRVAVAAAMQGFIQGARQAELPSAEQLGASTVRGALGAVDLFPGCQGADRGACIEGRIQAMSRAATAGATDELRDLVAWPLVALAFVSGFAVALALAFVRVAARKPPGEPAPSHRAQQLQAYGAR